MGAAIETGDTVTVCSRRGHLKRGELPNGTTGVVVGFESVPSPFTAGERIVLAEVNFGYLGTHKVSLNAVSKTFGRMECPAPPLSFREEAERLNIRMGIPAQSFLQRDAVREAQKHADLAAAHERVAKALDDLRKVEESYR